MSGGRVKVWFDVTRASRSGHASGLQRVSRRLLAELAIRPELEVEPVTWRDAAGWRRRTGGMVSDGVLFTSELFSERERPGIGEALASGRPRTVALFHDAIPLRHPELARPHAIGRHPSYMKLLVRAAAVLADSRASRDELLGYWRWLGGDAAGHADVEAISLGADGAGVARTGADPETRAAARRILCVGIIEPRKGQDLIVEAVRRLHRDGRWTGELVFVGRENRDCGRELARALRRLEREVPGVRWAGPVPDRDMDDLAAGARATVFPSRAEGSGLPVGESLWKSIPCLCADRPVLREWGGGGGVSYVSPADEPGAWAAALDRCLSDDGLVRRLASEAARADLPTWSGAAGRIADCVMRAAGRG